MYQKKTARLHILIKITRTTPKIISVFLCLNHHNKFDSNPSQTKGLQPEEVKTAKVSLEEQVDKDFPSILRESASSSEISTTDTKGISIELYDRRYPVYSAFWEFVLAILREASVPEKERKEYVEGISDALFLFNDEIDAYL